MVTDAQIGVALEAFDQKAGYSKIEKMRAALEAALSAAEPVAWLVKRYNLEGVLLDTELSFVRPTIKSTCRTDMEPLYAGLPAPSVAVKALEWGRTTTSYGHLLTASDPFGRQAYGIRVEDGTTDEDIAKAKAIHQADYEARIRSALSAQVQDTHELRTETCQRCQGNGEIVTDWERYRHPHENDVGDEAVSECPDCDGIGKVAAQVQDVAGWERITIETGRKSGTSHADAWPEGEGWEIDTDRGRVNTPDAGWNRFSHHEELYFRRRIDDLPAAPAKQEDGSNE